MTNDVAIPAQYPAISRMMQRLALETEITDEDGFRYDIADIIENIVNGETIEDVFARQEAGSLASKDFTNTPFTLDKSRITWKKSNLGGSTFPFFALLRVVDSDGVERVINAGGATTVAVLDTLTVRGYLDEERTLMFVEKPTASGYSIIMLKPVNVPRQGKGK